MAETTYRNRRAVQIENDQLRLTMTVEGGHIAEILHKRTGVNPLWTPPWPSIEPSTYSLAKHPEYGSDAESKLLAGIMGHNLCLDTFGGVTEDEAAAGLTVHGEGSVAAYKIDAAGAKLTSHVDLPQCQLSFTRKIELAGDVVIIEESVHNNTATDRPSAWTQHVTLGPPFIERGLTEFRVPATKSKVFEEDFGDAAYAKAAAEFEWPNVPAKKGGTVDLRTYPAYETSGGYTAHLMDPKREQVYFVGWSPRSTLAFGYIWSRADFPWLGIWEENHSRTTPPWNGKTMTRGMEFGASPIPETRKKMITRGSMFGVPGYKWIPAGKTVTVRYASVARVAPKVVEELAWDGGSSVKAS